MNAKRLWIVVVAAMVLAACGSGVSSEVQEGVPPPGTSVLVPMTIEQVGLVGWSDNPPRPVAEVTGVLRDSCDRFFDLSQTRDNTSNTIIVTVAVARSSTDCGGEPTYWYQDIPLEGDFPPGDYVVQVNSTPVLFRIQP